MTLRNLLVKIPFDSILPFIKKEKGADPAYCYKQAYDILLHTEPCEDGCMDIEVKMHEDWDGTKYVSASSKTIFIVAEDDNLEEEMALMIVGVR